jgi:DedD protein
MAAAVILIPEMLSGPRRAPAPAAPLVKEGEGSLKRYTVDLGPATTDSPTTATTIIEEAAPPPEDVPAEPVEQPDLSAVTPEVEQGELPTAQPADATPAAAEPLQLAESPPQVEPTAPSVPIPADQPQAVPAGRRWAVQLIATDKREQAQRMAEDLRNGNMAAFVMPVETKTGATLYRVRVGPFMSRAEAEDALRKLKAVSSIATIVAQP